MSVIDMEMRALCGVLEAYALDFVQHYGSSRYAMALYAAVNYLPEVGRGYLRS